LEEVDEADSMQKSDLIPTLSSLRNLEATSESIPNGNGENDAEAEFDSP
jgi:hypothetical protein